MLFDPLVLFLVVLLEFELLIQFSLCRDVVKTVFYFQFFNSTIYFVSVQFRGFSNYIAKAVSFFNALLFLLFYSLSRYKKVDILSRRLISSSFKFECLL